MEPDRSYGYVATALFGFAASFLPAAATRDPRRMTYPGTRERRTAGVSPVRCAGPARPPTIGAGHHRDRRILP